MVNIFMDKPENCEEISRGDLAKLVPDFEEEEDFREYFGHLFKSIDKNQDGIVSCYGDLKIDPTIFFLEKHNVIDHFFVIL